MSVGRKNFLILGGCLVLALALVWLFIGVNRVFYARERQNGWSYHPGRLGPGMSVGQTFICREPGLARIDVRLGTYGLPLPQAVELRLVEIRENLPRPLASAPLVTEGGVRVKVADGDQVGQTFIPRRPGMQGLWLEVDSRKLAAGAEVVVELWLAGRFHFKGRRLVRRVLKADQLPRLGFTRVDFNFSAAQSKRLVNRRLLFTVHTKGAPQGRELGMLFVSRNLNFKKVDRLSTTEATWIPGNISRDPNARLHERGYWLGDLVFRLAYRPSMPLGPVIRTARLSGWRMIDNGFNAFTFAPVADSKGKSYYCYLVMAGKGYGVTALADTKTRYPYGCLVLDGVPTKGSLAFRAYTIRPRGAAARELLHLISMNKPGPFGSRWLLPGLMCCLVILLGLSLFLVLAVGRRQEKTPGD